MLRRLLLLAVCYAVLVSAYDSWRWRPVDQPPGVLAPDVPEQRPLIASDPHDPDWPPPMLGRYRIEPVARYALTARLLSRERYRFDTESDVAPLDFALGWGPMSDSAVLDRLDISQSHRFFRVHWRNPPLPPRVLLGHAANTHLIPAGPRVRAALDTMRPGQRIALRGWLVDVRRDDGWHWVSSRRRDDTGAGACELMWVVEAQHSP